MKPNYETYLINRGNTKASIKTYLYIVDKYSKSGQEIADFINKFGGNYRNKIINILSNWCEFLILSGKIKENPCKKIKQTKTPSRVPKFSNSAEIEQIISNIKGSGFKPLRALAIIELGIAVGIRTNELSNIELQDIDFSNKKVKLKRKGNVESIKDLTEQACQALTDYLVERNKVAKCNYLFVNDRGGQLKTPYFIIKPYLGKLTPHQFFRHSLAVGLLRNGMDLERIRRVMDHKSITTTAVYLRAVDPELSEDLRNKHPRSS